jgi:phosphoglucosamine mutase
MPELSKRMKKVEKRLGKHGRILVRWSGTEPKLRLMAEGPDAAELESLVSEMADAARRDFGSGA